MSDQAAFHDGYRKALEDVSALVDGMEAREGRDLGDLLDELSRRIERARCLSRSSLAAGATGKKGF
jgi:hypothetical protein